MNKVKVIEKCRKSRKYFTLTGVWVVCICESGSEPMSRTRNVALFSIQYELRKSVSDFDQRLHLHPEALQLTFS